MTFHSARRLLFWLQAVSILMLVSAGCAPVADSNKPAGKPVSPLVTSENSSHTAVPAKTKIGDRQRNLTDLLSLIRARLDLMSGVAQAKWNRKLPITDPKREATLLEGLQARGMKRNLPGNFVREFFEAQIKAAKLIQEQHFADWNANQHPPFPQPPDLEREIRPKIDKLNEQLLEALSQYCAERSNHGADEQLDSTAKTVFETAPFSKEVIQSALEPLRI
jgi:chorismate mutase-like protein